jgi:hypothetical protein
VDIVENLVGVHKVETSVGVEVETLIVHYRISENYGQE